VDPCGGSWRVLDDAGEPVAAPQTEGAGPPSRTQWWVAVAIAIVVAVAAGGWLLLSSAGAGESTHVTGVGDPLGSPTRSAVPRVAAVASGGTGGLVGPLARGAPTILVIEVNGAVRHPSVVRLPDGARVVDAITAAGGYGPRVDSIAAQTINLAAKLIDGQQIHVPSRDDAAEPAGTTSGASRPGAGATGTRAGAPAGTTSASGPVDLNTATEAELEALPAIGPVTAAKIIDARQQSPFQSVDDLRERKLVGPATLEKIRALVTIR